MPSVYNGIGTWYYGKKNISRRQGVCKFCKRSAWLDSYDTRLFFVVIFVPIIPLKRVHVMDQCSSCRRHSAINGANWDTLQARADAAVEAANRSPKDEKLAADVLGACVTLRDVARFEKIAPDYESRFATSPKLLAMLAEAHWSFGRIDDAERILRAAAAKTDEPEPHEALGRILSLTNRPAEALPYLQHIIDDVIPDRVDDIYQLAQSYQRVGQHSDAIAMFDACRRIYPQIEQNKTYQKLRATSESLINTNKPVDSGKMLRGERTRAQGKRLLKIGGVIVALLALGYLAWALTDGYRANVFLVNGLDRGYTVLINGNTYSLAGHQVTNIRIPEGDVRIEASELAGIAATSVKISSPLFSRPFGDNVFVINPDRGAVLVKSRIVYAAAGYHPQEVKPAIGCGQLMIHFIGIDYPFTAPPQSLQVENNTTTIKTELQLLPRTMNLSPESIVATLQHMTAESDVIELVKAHAAYDADGDEYLQELAGLISADQLTQFLKEQLPSHAESISWNRMYIYSMSRTGHEDEVSKEYQEKLAKDPTSRVLQLMAALTEHHPARYLELLRKAGAELGAPIEAHARLAGYLTAIGEFHDGANEAEIALAKLDDQETRLYASLAYIGDRQLEKALHLAETDENLPPPRNINAVREAAWLLNRLGRSSEVAGQEQMLENIIRNFDAQQQQTLRQEFYGNVAYSGGDELKFINSVRQSNDPEDHFFAAVTAGELQTAKNDLAALPASSDNARNQEARWFDNITLYIASARSNPEIAQPLLAEIIQKMQHSDFEERAYAAALQGKTDMSDQELTHLRDDPMRRRLTLTAIGLAQPARAKACFAMVRKINGYPGFPKLLIDKALASASSN